MKLIGEGSSTKGLGPKKAAEIIRSGVEGMGLRSGQKLLAIIPDNTRSFDPTVVRTFLQASSDHGTQCDLLIANGTHAAMSEAQIDKFLCRRAAPEVYRDVRVYNHSPAPEGLISLGALDQETVRELSCGRLAGAVEIAVNRRILDYDRLVIIGPVFPHEVVGMSGGAKYLFPGIAGVEVINQSHWLGALIGIRDVIGRAETPVRRMIEMAGELVLAKKPVACISLVISQHDLHGLYFGGPVESHRAAAELSREVNIVWTERRYRRVVAECPVKYDELWTGGKLAYKTQEVVEKGGEIVLYAPHLEQIAPQHPDVEKIGYHCLDYFFAQWDRFKSVERSSLAHSTHVAGPGVWAGGKETLDARRVLASRIPAERCEKIHLDYLDPAGVSFADRGGDEETLWVPQAGEQLFMCADRRGSL